MPPEIGYSFNPSQAPDLRMDQGSGGGRGLSPQQAVKILSLRVPERASQGAIAPLPLLQSKGSGAAGAQGLDTFVAALMRAFAPQTATPGVPVLGGGPDTFGAGLGRERDLNRPPMGEPTYGAQPPPFSGGQPPSPWGGSPPPPRVTPGKVMPSPPPMPMPSPHPAPSPVGKIEVSPPPPTGGGDFPPLAPQPSSAPPSLFEGDLPWKRVPDGLDLTGLF